MDISNINFLYKMIAKKNYDDFINSFSKDLIKLNKTHSIKLFNKLLKSLLKRKKFAIDQHLWEMLYYQSVYFYKNSHKIKNIPIYYVTKHNQILSFYMSKKIHKLNCTIIRFDTHSDINDIKDSHKLPMFYQKFLETGNKNYIEKAQKLVWDIGAAKSGVIMTTGAKDIIWCLPKWVPDEEIQIEYFIKENKKSLSLQSADDNSEFDMVRIDKVPKKYKDELKIYKKIQINSKHNYLEKIKNLISKNGNKYILDIDLDYFICNGDKFNKSYFQEPFDLESNYRTKTLYINQNSPRDKNHNSEQLTIYTQQLNREIKKINKRINQFITLIRNLKKSNLYPCLITMSDSSNVMFGDCVNCNTVSNGYVPSHLALYVHHIVVNKLKKLF
jgi:hypothetical protein